ncbi:methyltransferase type 12 [Pseudothauera nasutitermitis]|uniref:Methyltransferase type 12 n=1 Tax=Pseudothauera nasutitermitis TaxID=2565930 RepID=A0A4S4AUE5_9RHOO|nr:fused MFS/spermidine synthase [Pseudothauera nasutitermitis]THF63569.1 methyltransferase type 12 [Pseudothauera nasutitermitis]
MSSAENAGPAPASALPGALLFVMVFVEGFSSLGAEIIALRRLVPYMGSAITVTAPTIGFFLLALALGYHAGGRVAGDYLARVRRNFLISAALIAFGLAGPVVDALFAALQPVLLAYLVFVLGVLCPVAWLLGQTVPILTNLLRHEHVGARSGMALYWSTLGSFLGSLSLSLLVMQWLGVSAAVLVCAGMLLAVAPFIGPAPGGGREWFAALSIGLGALGANLLLPQHTETAYATYRVEQVRLPGLQQPRVFWVNNSVASIIDRHEPPRYSRYIERLRARFEEMGLRGRRIAVLGAGGFTLSHRAEENEFVYVDIDPAIRELAERDFLGEPIRGRFVADDARQFVATTRERFDVVVVDAYSALTSIPAHLVTREFWRDTRRALAPDGILFANLLLDARLATPYARNLLATIEAEYGRCAVEILFHDRSLSNVLVQCFADAPMDEAVLYSDERNQADLDVLRSR